ncbi:MULTISPECIES: competence type IV pilus major pilin ComGC [unclassified Sporosarcina]|uniref:competence type IV pilus major pilin ComGC n=1 Tax=unclassified Sporosarcina TaxID=2647733 RepID=UPI000C171686|nr:MULTISPECIES: competence type IV pilus major pilin ComGC [unclassified Sporosarcina]PID06660.1 competence protein ComG [Sporosarcina sp. P30]PID09854.1 competence protein ComG [Sporosarcina sp. P31]PID13433.1 competence protein ComG [Sporosarcina sp. P32b]
MLKNEKGFTLIEMMIVLLIITVLILIAIPNVTKHSKSIDEKGCEAYVKMVEGQVQAYKMDKKTIPTISSLTTEGYLPAEPACPNGKAISIDGEGKVTAPKDGG